LVSAGMVNGKVQWVEAEPERGGKLRLADPFGRAGFASAREPEQWK